MAELDECKMTRATPAHLFSRSGSVFPSFPIKLLPKSFFAGEGLN